MNIIELAKQAGIVYREFEDEFANANTDGVDFKTLEAFAVLVAAAARADEREKCAKLVVNLFDPADNVAEFIAGKILARETT